MRARTTFVVAGLMLAAACSDVSNPVTSPRALIYDGAHSGGNPHFYFLPPLVPAVPSTAPAEMGLAPEVVICEWDGSGCTATVAHFTTDPATTTTSQSGNSETVRGQLDHYIVNWHTSDFPLSTSATYQICVMVGGLGLGFAEVDVVGTGKDLKNVATDQYIPLLDGRTLPIQFRIEQGALDAASSGCGQGQPT